MVKIDKIFYPIEKNSKIYDDIYKNVYKKFYKISHPIIKGISKYENI